MAKAAASPILQFIRRVVEDPQVRQLPDGGLLPLFDPKRARAAFPPLWRGRGPMVLDVCRGVWGAGPAADAVFEATSLVLPQKGGSIRKGASRGSWLQGAARR